MSEPTSPNVPAFSWSTQRETAALLVAEDRLSNDRIGDEVGVTAKQVERWKQHPAFMARVQEHIEAQREAIKRRGIAEKQNRVDELVALFADLKAVKAARAARFAGLTGGDTGLIVPEPTMLKVYAAGGGLGGNRVTSTRETEIVEVEKFDAAFFKEYRATLKQVAEETADQGADIDPAEMTDEELDAVVRSRPRRRV